MFDSKAKASKVLGRKATQVLNGAWRVFRAEGYSGASVDVIARDAGVSKATLYSYFPDKGTLFHAALDMSMALPRPQPLAEIGPDLPVEKAIPRITAAIAGWLISEHEPDLYRVTHAESLRFPEISRAYHRRLATLLDKPLQKCLSDIVDRRLLKIDDIPRATQHLIGLCRNVVFDQTLAADDAELPTPFRHATESAAWMFLRAYGTETL